jgi:hypothetical protein
MRDGKQKKVNELIKDIKKRFFLNITTSLPFDIVAQSAKSI